MLNLKDKMKPYVKVAIGDGMTTSMWYDSWNGNESLSKNISRRDIYDVRFCNNAKVADMIRDGADNRPPMLDKTRYNSWASRMLLYIKGKENRKLLVNLVLNGPFKYGTITVPGTQTTHATVRYRTYDELTYAKKLRESCDIKATNIVLQGLTQDIYNLVNHHEEAKNIWDRVKLLIEGFEISLHERESKLYDEFDMFTLVPEETIHSYYLSKFVTDVKLAKDLNNINFDQLYAYLRQHEAHADKVPMMKERFPNPLALGRQNQGYAGSGARSNATGVNITGGTNTEGQEKVIRCYNCQEEGHMARQCTKPKRLRNSTWFKEKAMLAEALEFGMDLDEEHMTFLTDNGDTNFFRETKNTVVQDTSSSAHQDAMIMSVIEEMTNQVAKCNKVIVDKNAKVADFENQIHSLNQQLNATVESHKTLSTTVDVLKMESNAKEDKYLDEIIDLEKKNKALDNVIYKMGQSAKVLALYCGNTIVKQHDALSVIDTEETLELVEESRIKMHSKQNDLIVQEKKVNIVPIDYVALNNLSEHFVKHFVPQKMENRCISPEIKVQQYKEIFQNNQPRNKPNVPEFPAFFEKNKLKAQLKAKDNSISKLKDHIATLKGKSVSEGNKSDNISKVISPGMYKLDLGPLSPKLQRNWEAHVDYLKHTQENADTLREIVKQARELNPLDSDLDSACQTFTIDGNTCPLTRITSTTVVPPKKPLSTTPNKKTPPCSNTSGKLKDITNIGKSKKHTQKPKSDDSIQEKLYLLHMDLCSPIRIESINGKKYILVIVDDYSWFTWVKFLRSKDETPEIMIKVLKKIQVRLNAIVCNIRTDNGTKFVNQTLQAYYDDVGISHQNSVACTP
ncbi:retrovirus-related pol polyprotein from transposon TNT 1-94 [Tanacetum coccineum]